MGVETIVRERSWGIIRNRCEGMDVGEKWEESMDRWREQQSQEEDAMTFSTRKEKDVQ